MNNITINDVAKHAGVSIATVSRVINRNYYVSADISERVLKAIEELNYYPNTVARSLKNDATLTIGFIVSDISNNYFTNVARALEDVIKKENYNLIVCSTENNKDRELAYLKLLIGKKIDGLIINTTGQNDEFISKLSKSIPTVLINRKIEHAEFKGDLIDSNNIEGAYILTSHLLSLGHRKIAIINGNLSVSTGKERFQGFKRAMQEAGINVNNGYPYIFNGDFTPEAGYQGASKMISMDAKPTAVAIMNNAMTLGALKYFISNNTKVPENISVAAYGNIDNIELLYVQPSIVSFSSMFHGIKVGELLMERIKNNSIANREIIYTPQLVIGNGVMQII